MRLILFWLICVAALSTFSVPSAAAFVADSFDAPKTKNIVKRGDFVGGGKKDARVPFVTSGVTKDDQRGGVLGIDFNVSEGYGGTYIIFIGNKVPANFNAVSFWVRGVPSSFKVELKDDAIHSYAVPKRETREWQKIEIPLSKFSNYETLEKSAIKEFVFVFEDHRTSPRLGKLFIDELSFVEAKETSNSEADIPVPSVVLVNGDIPLGKVIKAGEKKSLKLSSRVANKGTFVSFRFEASVNQRHWFLLNEEPFSGEAEFEFEWNVSGMLPGNYALRAVAVSADEKRAESEISQFVLKNDFKFDRFLDEVQRKTFDYFWHEVDPKVYLVKDRTTPDSVYATGLTGFQFSAYVIGVERGWIKKKDALRRMNATMNFFLNDAHHYHGLVSHWFSAERKEVWEIGIGDIVETSYILAGALTAKAYFSGKDSLEKEFREKVDRFSARIEWDELTKRPKKEDETGLIAWHWDDATGSSKLEVRGYNEAMIVYLFALGAEQYAVSEKSYVAWASTYQRGKYSLYDLIACAPLFTHQYTHLWVDYRGIKDKFTNYFENATLATLANREFSLKENQYPLEIWGLTASEGPNNYKAYGAPPTVSSVPVLNDGTIAPTAALTSVMFTPELSIAAMKSMRELYGDKIWGKYGFMDAFNPKRRWSFNGYLGLDQGPIILAIENYRTGLIWKLFMQNEWIKRGLERAGFKPE